MLLKLVGVTSREGFLVAYLTSWLSYYD